MAVQNNAPVGSGYSLGGSEASDEYISKVKGQAAAARLAASRKSHEGVLNSSYQYPKDLGIGEGDLINWMKFQAYQISGGFKDTKVVQFSNTGMGYAALPIPAGIQASYDQSWNQSSVGAMQQAGARLMELVPNGARGVTNYLTGQGVGGSSSSFGERVEEQFGTASVGQEIIAAGLKKTGLAETMQFTMGVRLLDQVMMSYGGPAFRNFSYTFALKPLNATDSQEIDNIVRFFKLASAPLRMSTQFSRLYDLPSVFEITFHNGWDENPNLPKIGKCALTNVGVSYGGDKFTTFDGTQGAPIQVDLTLQFKEMELLDRDNFVGNDF